MTFLELLIVILIAAWLFGWSFAIAGSLIHLLLIIALLLFVYRLWLNRNNPNVKRFINDKLTYLRDMTYMPGFFVDIIDWLRYEVFYYEYRY